MGPALTSLRVADDVVPQLSVQSPNTVVEELETGGEDVVQDDILQRTVRSVLEDDHHFVSSFATNRDDLFPS